VIGKSIGDRPADEAAADDERIERLRHASRSMRSLPDAAAKARLGTKHMARIALSRKKSSEYRRLSPITSNGGTRVA
jgi:hypothetical protein